MRSFKVLFTIWVLRGPKAPRADQM
jgi:hypothetical protein